MKIAEKLAQEKLESANKIATFSESEESEIEITQEEAKEWEDLKAIDENLDFQK